jgi:predicted metalloprotease with PDZ domain
LLDARIRREADGKRSLDDLMRLAFERFSGERGFTSEEFKATAEEVAGNSLRSFFARAVESTEELDYSEALEWFGLQFKASEQPPEIWLGAETRIDNGRLIVSRVIRDGPAWHAGLSVDDEIIAIDDFRVKTDQLAKRLENYHPGESVALLVARREQLKPVRVTLRSKPAGSAGQWQLELNPGATTIQKQHLNDWLAPSI